MINISKRKIKYSLNIGCLIILASYVTKGFLSSLQPVALLVLLISLLFGTKEDNLVLMIMLIPYNSLLVLSGASIRGIFYLVASLKLLKRYGKIRISKYILVIMSIWIFIEIANDIWAVEIFSLLNIVCGMLYFGMIVGCMEFEKIDVSFMANMLCVSFIIAIGFALIAGGGLQSYNNTISSFRFGQEAVELGGAMAIPIYAGIIVGVMICRLSKNIGSQIVNLIVIVFVVVLGALTISRNFVLIFGVMILFCIYWQIKHYNIRMLKIEGLCFLLLAMAYFFNRELIDNVLLKFTERITIGESSRIDIYVDCLRYLFSNIKACLFGEGCINYHLLGEQQNYSFSMMAHNLFLDAWMSWGIVGITCFGVILYLLGKKLKVAQCLKRESIYILPALAYFAAILTEGSFNYANVYMYILFCFIYMRGEAIRKVVG